MKKNVVHVSARSCCLVLVFSAPFYACPIEPFAGLSDHGAIGLDKCAVFCVHFIMTHQILAYASMRLFFWHSLRMSSLQRRMRVGARRSRVGPWMSEFIGSR